MTLRTLEIKADAHAQRRTLLVLLPGLNMTPEDFLANGFVAESQKDKRAIDAVAVGAASGDYFDNALVAALHANHIRPAKARGDRVVCLGISLGALGSLLVARAHGDDLDGVVLLAPFLGTTGTIAEIERAGGLGEWSPGRLKPSDFERHLLVWLQAFTRGGATSPWLKLGYGRNDRFAPAARLLAAALPGDAVTVAAGGHDWPTWRTLWREMLDHGLGDLLA